MSQHRPDTTVDVNLDISELKVSNAKTKATYDGIFELRCKQESNIIRVLYFFYIGKKIIATNGFVKKTQKTPPKELKLAKERRADWLERHKEVQDDT